MLLDTAYVIFNNTPPRMAPGEARFSLSCPEICFQADNVSTWSDAIQSYALSELGQRQPVVHQVISMLWADSLSDADEVLLRSMSSLNLFILVHRKLVHYLPYKQFSARHSDYTTHARSN